MALVISQMPHLCRASPESKSPAAHILLLPSLTPWHLETMARTSLRYGGLIVIVMMFVLSWCKQHIAGRVHGSHGVRSYVCLRTTWANPGGSNRCRECVSSIDPKTPVQQDKRAPRTDTALSHLAATARI